MTSDAELNLAIAACRAAFADDSAKDIEQLARTVDWDRFLRIVGTPSGAGTMPARAGADQRCHASPDR